MTASKKSKVKRKREKNPAKYDCMKSVVKFYSKNRFFYDNSIFWLWDDKIKFWKMIDRLDLFNEFDDFLKLGGQTIEGRSNYVEALMRYGKKNRPMDAPKNFIQFRHKYFDLDTKTLHDVTPDYFFCNPIMWEIGKTDETPVMDMLFKDWVGEKYVRTLYEIIAYCCYTDYPIHAIFFLTGNGRNGKSTFIRLVKKFIGDMNICTTELYSLLQSRFESVQLYKKTACLIGETNFNNIEQTSRLKSLSGQDLIRYEFKGKTGFTGENYAKIIIASNFLPISKDDSEGFYRRWKIIDFPNKFEIGKDILKIVPSEEYENLARKVCLILPELLEKGKFTNELTPDEMKKEYIKHSNPFPEYAEQYCEFGSSYKMTYNSLYFGFVDYLRQKNLKIISSMKFNIILSEMGLVKYYTTIEDKQKYCVRGIRFKYKEQQKSLGDIRIGEEIQDDELMEEDFSEKK